MGDRFTREPVLPPFYRDSEFMHWVWMTAMAFAALIVVSFGAGLLLPSIPASISEQFSRVVEEAGVVDADGKYSAAALFIHNLQAMAMAVGYGLIPLIHLPAALLGLNAILIGSIGAYCVNNGVSLLFYLAGIMPHGIFELPAIILSLACGLYLCSYLTGRIFRRDKVPQKPVFRRIGRVFCMIIAPLLLIAALLEAYLTPLILSALQ